MVHKKAVIRTLLDRQKLVSDEVDKKTEYEHVCSALRKCGYPQSVINKTQAEMIKPKQPSEQEIHLGFTTLPYVKGITEKVQRSLTKYNIKTAVKPYNTLRRSLVHPKDRIETLEKCNVVYKINCKTCNKSYIGETGRKLSTRISEHRKDSQQVQDKIFTRRARQDSLATTNKSAITDHVASNNCIIDWEDVTILDNEKDKSKRWIKEAIHIRKNGNNINRDSGNHDLSRLWDNILK